MLCLGVQVVKHKLNFSQNRRKAPPHRNKRSLVLPFLFSRSFCLLLACRQPTSPPQGPFFPTDLVNTGEDYKNTCLSSVTDADPRLLLALLHGPERPRKSHNQLENGKKSEKNTKF